MTGHVFEIAPSGRSKCRGCGRTIEKGTLRFGERMPNPFGDGDMTHWHHPRCAAHRRPEPMLEALEAGIYPDADSVELITFARHGIAHRRLPRLGSAEQAPSGRARCRHCRELIEKDAWRLPLVFFEEGAYNGGGFIHAACAREYCETEDVVETVACFAPELSTDEVSAILEV